MNDAEDGSSARRGDSTLPGLTSLRWCAALIVFASHEAAAIPIPAIEKLATKGWSGVSFFFVLSGFLLVWAQRGPLDPRRFWRRRLARVYPSHLAVFLLSLPALYFLAGPLQVVPGIFSMFLFQAWIPDSDYYFAYNGVTWSLSCEAFFYALFPILLRRLVSMSRKRRLIFVSCAYGLASVVQAVGGGFGISTDMAIYVNPAVRLPEFLMGMAAALELREGRRPSTAHLRVAIVVPIFLCLGIWTFLPDRRGYSSAAISCLFLAVVVWVATSDIRARRSILWWKPLQRLGELSFAFYLVHQLVARATHSVWSDAVWRIPLDLAGSLTLAWLLNVAVERPWERRISGRLPAQADVS